MNDLVRAQDAAVDRWPGEPVGEAGQAAQNPWQMVDEKLRGRWRYAIALGATLGAIIAVVAYLLAPVNFVSVGRIEGIPVIRAGLAETPETGMLPMYQQFLASRAEIFRTERVLERALRDEKLRALNPADKGVTLQSLRKDLGATVVRGTNLIAVTYEAKDAAVAAEVVNAVMRSFFELNPAEEQFESRRRELHNHREQKQTQLLQKQRDKTQYLSTSRYGVLPLNELTSIKGHELFELEKQERELAARIAELENVDATAETTVAAVDGEEGAVEGEVEGDDAETRPPTELAADDVPDPTPFDLDSFDPELATLRRNLRAAESEFEKMLLRFAPTHRSVTRLRESLEVERDRLTVREAETRERWIAAQLERPSAMTPNALATGDLESLRRRRVSVQESITAVKRELAQISTESAQLQQFDNEIAQLQRELRDRALMIENFEASEDQLRQGRLHIVSEAVRAEYPEKDRRLQMAAVGFIGGCGLGFGLFFLLGTVDRRAYSASQLRAGQGSLRPHLLGVLPDMSQDASDPESSDLASQCVHRIRNRVETMRSHDGGYVLSVTSPFQGDGKTSVAMSLGWSYAASGCRTILVDLDFIGRSLSHHTGRLRMPGVKEVLRSNVLNGEVGKLTRPNLSVLGIGLDKTMGPETVRRGDFERLFAMLRQQYDMIIVDTGPLLASVESLPIAISADGVLLTLRRGRPRSRLEECVQELRHSGANYLGVVLNCADRSDCDRYTSLSRMSVALRDDGSMVEPPAPKNSLVQAIEFSASSNGQDQGEKGTG